MQEIIPKWAKNTGLVFMTGLTLALASADLSQAYPVAIITDLGNNQVSLCSGDMGDMLTKIKHCDKLDVEPEKDYRVALPISQIPTDVKIIPLSWSKISYPEENLSFEEASEIPLDRLTMLGAKMSEEQSFLELFNTSIDRIKNVKDAEKIDQILKQLLGGNSGAAINYYKSNGEVVRIGVNKGYRISSDGSEVGFVIMLNSGELVLFETTVGTKKWTVANLSKELGDKEMLKNMLLGVVVLGIVGFVSTGVILSKS